MLTAKTRKNSPEKVTVPKVTQTSKPREKQGKRCAAGRANKNKKYQRSTEFTHAVVVKERLHILSISRYPTETDDDRDYTGFSKARKHKQRDDHNSLVRRTTQQKTL